MPVDHRLAKDDVRYQREAYAKSFISKTFRDFLDRLAMEVINDSDNILDVGCGEGVLFEKIIATKKNAVVYGIDLCPENVEICLAHNLPAILADAKRLPFKDEAFDVCIMTEVIEHLERDAPQGVVREIARVLKRNGKFLLMFPNDRNYRITRLLTFKFKEAFYNAGHTRQWKPMDAIKLLQENSFSVYKTFSVPIDSWNFSLNHIVIGIKNTNV